MGEERELVQSHVELRACERSPAMQSLYRFLTKDGQRHVARLPPLRIRNAEVVEDTQLELMPGEETKKEWWDAD